MATPVPKSLLALDVGNKRIGVAIVSLVTKLPQPLTTLVNSDDGLNQLQKIIGDEQISAIVIGLPRGLSGQTTEQTAKVRNYRKKLAATIDLPIFWQDEALTSQKAEEELRIRGVGYNKEQVDALAATYILSDFLSERREEKLV